MIDDIFTNMANEVFQIAGIKIAEAPELYKETKWILSKRMAHLSATLGLTYERVKLFEEQKQALIADLIKLKKDGTLG